MSLQLAHSERNSTDASNYIGTHYDYDRMSLDTLSATTFSNKVFFSNLR